MKLLTYGLDRRPSCEYAACFVPCEGDADAPFAVLPTVMPWAGDALPEWMHEPVPALRVVIGRAARLRAAVMGLPEYCPEKWVPKAYEHHPHLRVVCVLVWMQG